MEATDSAADCLQSLAYFRGCPRELPDLKSQLSWGSSHPVIELQLSGHREMMGNPPLQHTALGLAAALWGLHLGWQLLQFLPLLPSPRAGPPIHPCSLLSAIPSCLSQLLESPAWDAWNKLHAEGRSHLLRVTCDHADGGRLGPQVPRCPHSSHSAPSFPSPLRPC